MARLTLKAWNLAIGDGEPLVVVRAVPLAQIPIEMTERRSAFAQRAVRDFATGEQPFRRQIDERQSVAHFGRISATQIRSPLQAPLKLHQPRGEKKKDQRPTDQKELFQATSGYFLSERALKPARATTPFERVRRETEPIRGYCRITLGRVPR